MTDIAVGDMVRGVVRYPMQHRADPGGVCARGTFRVTAVKGDRVYVDHVEGAKFCDGIRGWDNLWFVPGDERLVRVDA